MRRTIVLTAHDRPGYLRRTLGALRGNDLGGWTLEAAVEPGNAHVRALVESFADAPATVTVNPKRLGVRKNPWRALERAFDAGADVVLYVEDDVLVSPDATALATWYAAHPDRDRALALCLLAYGSDPGRPEDVVETSDPVRPPGVAPFPSLGVVFTRSGWARARGRWFDDDGWDRGLGRALADGAAIWHPAWSRSTHIGRLAGSHCEPDFHDRTFGGLAWNRRARHRSFRLAGRATRGADATA